MTIRIYNLELHSKIEEVDDYLFRNDSSTDYGQLILKKDKKPVCNHFILSSSFFEWIKDKKKGYNLTCPSCDSIYQDCISVFKNTYPELISNHDIPNDIYISILFWYVNSEFFGNPRIIVKKILCTTTTNSYFINAKRGLEGKQETNSNENNNSAKKIRDLESTKEETPFVFPDHVFNIMNNAIDGNTTSVLNMNDDYSVLRKDPKSVKSILRLKALVVISRLISLNLSKKEIKTNYKQITALPRIHPMEMLLNDPYVLKYIWKILFGTKYPTFFYNWYNERRKNVQYYYVRAKKYGVVGLVKDDNSDKICYYKLEDTKTVIKSKKYNAEVELDKRIEQLQRKEFNENIIETYYDIWLEHTWCLNQSCIYKPILRVLVTEDHNLNILDRESLNYINDDVIWDSTRKKGITYDFNREEIYSKDDIIVFEDASFNEKRFSEEERQILNETNQLYIERAKKKFKSNALETFKDILRVIKMNNTTSLNLQSSKNRVFLEFNKNNKNDHISESHSNTKGLFIFPLLQEFNNTMAHDITIYNAKSIAFRKQKDEKDNSTIKSMSIYSVNKEGNVPKDDVMLKRLDLELDFRLGDFHKILKFVNLKELIIKGADLKCGYFFEKLPIKKILLSNVSSEDFVFPHRLKSLTLSDTCSLTMNLKNLDHTSLRKIKLLNYELPFLSKNNIIQLSMIYKRKDGKENEEKKIRIKNSYLLIYHLFYDNRNYISNMKQIIFNLTTLNITNSGFELFPVYVSEFPNLKKLVLSGNGITEKSLYNNFSFSQCKKLEYVSLSFNKISIFKTSLVTNTRHPFVLDISNNRLSSFEDDVLYDFSGSKRIIIRNNKKTKRFITDNPLFIIGGNIPLNNLILDKTVIFQSHIQEIIKPVIVLD